jgi:hypothetical protein
MRRPVYLDRSSFFFALGTLAVGAVAGYVVSDRSLLKGPEPASGPAEPVRGITELQRGTDVSPAASAALPLAPACSDMVGAPGACPPPGYPADEGSGCGGFTTRRCEDFKQSMKPRVAERAVACLNSLSPGQRCDPNRVNLCAHAALMSACPEVDAPLGTLAATADEVVLSCDAIARGCGGVAITPTMRDCRATLAGLSMLGRDQMATCMKTHCGDKGLLGCEAVIDANAKAAQAP